MVVLFHGSSNRDSAGQSIQIEANSKRCSFSISVAYEYKDLKNLSLKCNGKHCLNLVFDLYGPSRNFYGCDSESGLPQHAVYKQSLSGTSMRLDGFVRANPGSR